jgi:hypothetical protein
MSAFTRRIKLSHLRRTVTSTNRHSDRIPGSTRSLLCGMAVIAAWCAGCTAGPNWAQSLLAPPPIQRDLSQDDAFVARVKKDKFPSAAVTSKQASE